MSERSWEGVIAYLDTPTSDGRELKAADAADPMLRFDLTPLIDVDRSDDPVVGRVDRAWIDGQSLLAAGVVLTEKTGDRIRRLEAGELVPVALQAVLDRWLPDGSFIRGWQLRHLALSGSPAWPTVGIRLVDG